MINGNKKEASIAVPLCLVIVVMSALIFTLAESVRYEGLKKDAEELTNLTAESLFAGYQPYLLEEYRMFFLDGGFGRGKLDIPAAEDKMTALLYDNFMIPEKEKGMNLYCMNWAEVKINEYMLATDENGKVFEAQAANMMKKTMGQQAAEKILNQIKKTEEKQNTAPDPEAFITNANDAFKQLEEAKKAEEEDQSKSEGEEEAAEIIETKPETDVAENPLTTIKKLKKEGILALVVPSGKAVSQKSVSLDQCLLNRTLNKGTYKYRKEPGWYERILTQEYIKPLAGNAVSPKQEGRLAYGTEYIICGKSSDEENLKKTVNKLLLLRETLNFLYLQSDEKKVAEALAAATAFAGASGIPAIITAVQQGILAAWAYVESICDVKELLAGGKVPLMKNSFSWKSQLSKLLEAVTAEGSKGTEGLSYENYLDVLLYVKTVKQLTYRSMDLMEWNMQNEEGYENCRMDCMITGMRLTAEYEAETLFFGIFAEDPGIGYQFFETAEYIYGTNAAGD